MVKPLKLLTRGISSICLDDNVIMVTVLHDPNCCWHVKSELNNNKNVCVMSLCISEDSRLKCLR